MSANDIVIVLLFIVPGFVTLSIRGFLSGIKRRTDFEFLYQSIVISFIINMGFMIYSKNIVSILKLAENERLTMTMQLAAWEIAVAVLLGLVMVCCTRWHFLKNRTLEVVFFDFFRWAKLTDRFDTGKVWESVCVGLEKDTEVHILLPGNLVAKGNLEYISDDPDLREVTLTSVVLMDAVSGNTFGTIPNSKKYYIDLGESLGLIYPHPDESEKKEEKAGILQ